MIFDWGKVKRWLYWKRVWVKRNAESNAKWATFTEKWTTSSAIYPTKRKLTNSYLNPTFLIPFYPVDLLLSIVSFISVTVLECISPAALICALVISHLVRKTHLTPLKSTFKQLRIIFYAPYLNVEATKNRISCFARLQPPKTLNWWRIPTSSALSCSINEM